MPNYTLESFISDCEDQAATHGEPADIVRAITPLMHRLLCGSRDFLKPEHFQFEPSWKSTRRFAFVTKDDNS